MTHTAARHRTLSHLVQPPFRLETTFELPEQRERPEEHEEERQQRPGDSSPFERELIQVDELVRTFNETQNVELAEDDALIRLKGLLCFTADAYMAEISLPFQFTWI